MSNFHVWIKKWIIDCNVNLQSLSLTFQSIDQFSLFQGNLRNLRHFSLKFDKKFARKCGWNSEISPEYTFKNCKDKYFKFLVQFIEQCNKLQTLRLDIAPYSITLIPLAYLLLVLNYHKVPNWYVRVGTESEDFLKIVNGVNIEEIGKMVPVGLKSTSEVLKTVDFLGIYVVNYLKVIWDEFASDKYEDYGAFRMSIPRLRELPEVICQYKKILDVTLTDFSLETHSRYLTDASLEKFSVNLKTILSRFPGLQGLYIKAVENVVLYEDNDDSLQKNNKKRSDRSEEIKEEPEKIIQYSNEVALPDEFGWMDKKFTRGLY